MTRFRRKPTEIQAIQYDGTNVQDIWDAFGVAGIQHFNSLNPNRLLLTTAHGGVAWAVVGTWIVPDAKPNTFYPVLPDVFAETYQRIDSVEEDFPHIGPETFSDKSVTVISHRGENFYRSCDVVVKTVEGLGSTHCVKHVQHKTDHEDFYGNIKFKHV